MSANGMRQGRVMAQEIMIVNGAIANLIREQKTAQIYSMIQTGVGMGMQTLDMCLKNLVNQKLCDPLDAVIKSQRPEEFKRSIGLATLPAGME